MFRKPLSSIHPVFYFASVWYKRLLRYFIWCFGKKKYSKQRSIGKLPFKVKEHQSILIRKLGCTDIRLQYNKVTNLSLAIRRIDGITIKPGETFSFCKLVGLATRRKGYLPGMLLYGEEAKSGTAGGICQIANLIHWLVIHSPLTVVERHHHSYDLFPDEGRVVPFGCGATVFYNYIDYQFTNCTSYTFQINLWLSEKFLEGELRISENLDYTYHVYEKEHHFIKEGTKYYRKNEIWRDKIAKSESGKILETELIAKNYAEVKYNPESYFASYTASCH